MKLKSNSIALPLLATLVMVSTAATANSAPLPDIEDNNTRANRTGVLYAANSDVSAIGNLIGTDYTDVYSIKNLGGNDGILEWNIYSTDNNAKLYVWEDINKNKRIDSSDSYLFSTGNYKQKDINSPKDTWYLAQIVRFSYKGDVGFYQMGVKAFKTVKLNVISAKNYGKFDNGNNKPDFYVKTKIGHNKSQSKVFPNNDRPVFNHFHQATLYPQRGYVPFEIQVWDSDGSRRKDDQADINPTPNVRTLPLVLDLYRKQVQTPNGTVLGPVGRAITVKGDRPGDQVAVTFTIR